MKLDPDLARYILLRIEEFPFDGRVHDIAIEGRSDEEISYHVMLLKEDGLIEALDLTSHSGVCWKPKRLTSSGHKFLDAARSDTVWAKAKAMALKSTGPLTLEALKVAIPLLVKRLM